MTALTHDQARQLLEMDREQLSGADWSALKQHLAECAACRSYAAELAALQGAVEHALQKHWQGVRPDPHLEQQVQTRIRKQTMPKQFASNILWLAGLAVFTLIAMALFSTRSQPAANSPAATPTGATLPTSTPPLTLTPAGSPLPVSTLLSGRDFYQFQRLSTANLNVYQPAISPDGRRLIYVGVDKQVENSGGAIYARDLASQVETRLTDESTGIMDLAWSPDGSRIAYTSFLLAKSSPETVDLMVMNADGSNKQAILNSVHRLYNDWPTWSPSGDRIMVVVDEDLLVINVNDRSEIRRFKSVVIPSDSRPVWFDEDRILFISEGHIKLGNVATGVVESIAGPTSEVQQVMARGTDIAYVQQEDSTARIVRQDLGGTYTTTVNVFPTGEYPVGAASWSPDGRFVAVQTMEDLFVATEHVPDSWHHAPLFNLKADLIFPFPVRLSWLPDSSGFVIEYAVNDEHALYLVQLNLETIQLVENNAPIAQVPPRLARLTPTPLPMQVGEPTPTPTVLDEQTFPSVTRMKEFFLTTTYDGYRPVLSPDGRSVIYAAERDGQAGIFTLDLVTQVETRLTTDTFRDLEVSWSPDGTRLAYEHVVPPPDGSTSTLERIVINADGSNKQVVSSGVPWSAGSEAPAWSPDGTRLAFTDNTQIVVVNVAEGRELGRFGSADVLIHSQPAWLDNTHVLFVGDKVVKVVNLTTGVVEKRVDTANVIQAVVVGSDIVYFQQDGSGARVIRLTGNGTQPLLLGVIPSAMIGSVTVSPDERFITAETSQGLYIITVKRSASRETEAALVLGTAEAPQYLRGAAWLPDGSGLLLVVSADNQTHLYLSWAGDYTQASQASSLVAASRPTMVPTPTWTPEPHMKFNGLAILIAPPDGAQLPAVSPDSQRVIYSSLRGGNGDIYQTDFATLTEKRLTDDPRTETAAAWSPDSSRLAYQRYAATADGAEAIEWMVMRADGSNPQVVASGTQRLDNERPAWSPAGDRLAVTDGAAIVVVSVNDRRELRRFNLTEKPRYTHPIWFDNDRLLFIDRGVIQLGNLTTGIVASVPGSSGSVAQVLAWHSSLVYIQQTDTAARVVRQNLDGTQIVTLANLTGLTQSDLIDNATLSPDGRYLTVQTEKGSYVAYVGADRIGMADFAAGTPSVDVLVDVWGITWLPDSSGFVCASPSELPNNASYLYLVQPKPGSEDTPFSPLILPTQTSTPTPVGETLPTPTPTLPLPMSTPLP